MFWTIVGAVIVAHVIIGAVKAIVAVTLAAVSK